MANTPATPRTWVAGNVMTAAQVNVDIRDNGDYILSSKPNARVFNSAAISITVSGTPQALTFDSERFDKGAGSHSTVTNTGRLTVPTGCGGTYLIGAFVSWAANATGYRAVALRVNGTTTIASDSKPVRTDGFSDHAPTTLYALSATDYVEVVVTQSSGGALNVAATPEFWWVWQST